MKTEITPAERALLSMHSKRPVACFDENMERRCREMVKRGYLRTARIDAVLPGGRQVQQVGFVITQPGRNVLAGKPAKTATAKQKERHQWAKETNADRKAGVKCCWPGCREVATEGHHAKKVRCRDNSRANRRPLCSTHHKYAEAHPIEALVFGITVSAHEKVQPASDREFGQYGGTAIRKAGL